MKVEFHPAARTEFIAQAHWYDRELPGVGDDFIAEVDHALRNIVNHPGAWPLWPQPKARRAGAHRFVLERFPFSLAYLDSNDQVYVVAVVHHRRRPNYWVGRLQTRE